MGCRGFTILHTCAAGMPFLDTGAHPSCGTAASQPSGPCTVPQPAGPQKEANGCTGKFVSHADQCQNAY
eukprot:1158739-Pelagomonas_calceolata.AAC.4